MIDWQRVINLKDEIGDEDFDEVVPLFIEEVSEITNRLRAGVDLDRLEGDLHCLKGSALNLGFSEFSDLCHAGESLSAKGKAATVDVTAILDCFEVSKNAFLSGLQDGIAA
ncbi:Hpt domain-containing protein [uncultured Tateyamaria sp.]|uniref:Hpt domain-containing protein n=1 Tax=uncultured Tateyamaria sp. TaxID=455651 RepID=UPI00262A801E|nr:Hpt domain-containing protein [uncultured Tateyamaria sp.]